MSLTVRTLGAHDWRAYRAIRLRALAEAPDAFCATLADNLARSDESWSTRMAAAAESEHDYPLIADMAGAPVGVLWAQVDAADTTVVNIFQVWVAPESRGLGVAAALLDDAINWARTRGARHVQLDVTSGDTAAARLYLRAGFKKIGEPKPRPGSPLSEQNMQLVLD